MKTFGNVLKTIREKKVTGMEKKEYEYRGGAVGKNSSFLGMFEVH